jgi:large subunit ribosomal protein L4
MSLTVNVFDTTGKKTGTATLDKSIFAAKVSDTLLALAVRVFLSRQRQGTKHVKTRGEVNYSTRKLYRQKGTGRARHGSKKAPIYVGGGQAHGPKGNENYQLKLTKKMRQRSLFGALTQKQTQNQISVINDLSQLKSQTKTASKLFNALNPDQTSNLLILDKPYPNVIKATRGLTSVTTTQASRINTYETLKHRHLIFTKAALKDIESRLNSTPATSSITKTQ